MSANCYHLTQERMSVLSWAFLKWRLCARRLW